MGRRPRSTSQRPAATGHLRLQVSLRRAAAFGPGKARLLEAIDATGSISAAARVTDMSYRRAWGLVIEMNGIFHAPLVTGHTGGPTGGGAGLTDIGRRVLALYREIIDRVDASLADDMASFESLLGPAEVTRASGGRDDGG